MQVYFCGLGPEPRLMALIKATGLPILPYNNAFGKGSLTGIYYLWSPMCLLGIVPAYGIGVILSLLISTIILKWILLGKIDKGISPLWSHWPCRWDYMFIFWDTAANNIAGGVCVFISGWLCILIFHC